MVIGTKEDILKRIGESIRRHRLLSNLPQRILAERSGVSLTSLKRLECGLGVTLETFVQVCRTLRLDGWIAEIEPRDEVSPIAYADALRNGTRKERKRAHV